MMEGFLKDFDLSPQELSWRILICEQNAIAKVHNQLTFINPQSLPNLPFTNHAFDLALCNHIFFAKNTGDLSFQLKTLLEFARVATEVRVFPLVDEQGKPSTLLGEIIQALQAKNFGVELRQVSTDKQSTHALLRFWNLTCELHPRPVYS